MNKETLYFIGKVAVAIMLVDLVLKPLIKKAMPTATK